MLTFTNVQNEPPQNVLTLERVSNFRVELNSVNFLLVVSDSSERSRFGSGDGGEVLGEGVKSVGVGHPNLKTRKNKIGKYMRKSRFFLLARLEKANCGMPDLQEIR